MCTLFLLVAVTAFGWPGVAADAGGAAPQAATCEHLCCCSFDLPFAFVSCHDMFISETRTS
eukprot:6594068-Prymnesium_polylepis.2